MNEADRRHGALHKLGAVRSGRVARTDYVSAACAGRRPIAVMDLRCCEPPSSGGSAEPYKVLIRTVKGPYKVLIRSLYGPYKVLIRTIAAMI